MFTVEMDHDEIVITTLDTTDNYEDVTVRLYDDEVYISQWNEDHQYFDSVIMTSEMYYSIMQAWTKSEGAYKINRKRNI